MDEDVPVDEEPRLGAAAFERLCADLPGLPAPLGARVAASAFAAGAPDGAPPELAFEGFMAALQMVAAEVYPRDPADVCLPHFLAQHLFKLPYVPGYPGESDAQAPPGTVAVAAASNGLWHGGSPSLRPPPEADLAASVAAPAPAAAAPAPLDVRPLLDTLRCSICVDTVSGPVTLLCGHSFCRRCVLPWVARERTCPECRHAVSSVLPPKSFMLAQLARLCGGQPDEEDLRAASASAASPR